MVDWMDSGNSRREAQERTKEELLESLRITLKEALDFNRDEALKAAEADYSEVIVTP